MKKRTVKKALMWYAKGNFKSPLLRKVRLSNVVKVITKQYRTKIKIEQL